MTETLARAAAPALRVEQPYKGLDFYGASELDALLFFGRESERKIIVSNLIASRLTILYGASGVGKSSVLHAGVAYHLRRDAAENPTERGTPEHAVVVFRSWRDDPLDGLAAAIAETVGPLLPEGSDRSPPATRRLDELLDAWSERLGGELLIILDQFEEYFLYHGTEDGEGTFSVEFPRAVNRPGLHAAFLVSIREDALSWLDRFKGRIPDLFENYLRLDHLDRAAARAAIREPVRLYNDDAGPDETVELDERLVEEVLDQIEELPRETSGSAVAIGPRGSPTGGSVQTVYLQMVMERLWRERGDARRLTTETLAGLGGAGTIVRGHFLDAVNALPEAEQAVAARAFAHLVTPAGGKIALTVTELADGTRLPAEQLEAVVDKLEDARVLSIDQSAEPRYQIYHDALAQTILDWRRGYENEQERRALEREREQAREEERRQQRTRRAFVFGTVVSGLLVVALAAAGFAFWARDEAADQRDLARSRELATKALSALAINPEESMRLARDAFAVRQTPEAEDALRTALGRSRLKALLAGAGGSRVLDANFSADGRLLVTAEAERPLRLWDVPGGRLIRTLPAGSATNAEFSSDGGLVISWDASDPDANDRARIWNVAGRREPAVLQHAAAITAAEFVPERRLAVTASADTTVRVWSEDGREVRRLSHSSAVTALAFAPDGTTLATAAGDGVLRLWRLRDGKLLLDKRPAQSFAQLSRPGFSPDGRRLIVGEDNGTVRILDVASGRQLDRRRGHLGGVTSATFGPGGRSALTVGRDDTARAWKVTRERLSPVASLKHAGLNGAELSPTGMMVVTHGSDSVARLWHAGSGAEIAALNHPEPLLDAAFSADGRLIATASEDGTTRLWRTRLREPDIALREHIRPLLDAAFDPLGHRVATVSLDGSMRMWTLATRDVLWADTVHNDVINAVAFSADGRLVATASADGTVKIFQAARRFLADQKRHPQNEVDFTSVAFGRDGSIVAGSTDETALVWTPRRAEPIILPGHDSAVRAASFSPDGARVLTADDRGARVWRVDAANPEQIAVMEGHRAPVRSAAFSPDGQLVVTASWDKTARIWDAESGELEQELTGHTGRLETAAFSDDGEFVVTGGADGTTRVWATEDGREIALIRTHDEGVNSASFDPDGAFVLTVGGDSAASINGCAVCIPDTELIRLTNVILAGTSRNAGSSAP